MKTIKEILKSNIKRFRNNIGLTQEKLISSRPELKLDLRSYQRAENGIIPRDENLSKVASILGVSEVELFQDQDAVATTEQAISIVAKELAMNPVSKNELLVAVMGLSPEQKSILLQALEKARRVESFQALKMSLRGYGDPPSSGTRKKSPSKA